MNPDQVLAQAKSLSEQTRAEGLKSYATSSYAKKTPINFNASNRISANLVASNPKPYKLPTQQTPTYGGIEPLIASQITQGQITQQQKVDEAKQNKDKSLQDYMNAIIDSGNIASSVDRTAQDEAKKNLDKYTSQLEAEQLANRRAIENLQKNNSQGLFGGGLEQEINRINRDSLSKQADIAILQSAANRDYSTAAEIADRQVQLKTEQSRLNLEALKLFYQDNKETFDKQEDRLYNEKIKAEERAYNKQETVEKTIADVKIELAKTGNSSLIRALSGIDTSKPGAFDEVLRIAAPGLATSNNDIVKLENGNTVVVNKRTGQVISNLGGGKAPTFVPRTVNGQPVTGYTLVAGDDPYFIAMQNGIDMATLKSVNPEIKDWNNIPVGATINVPQAPEESFMQKLQGSEGGKPLTDTTIQKLDKGLTVLAQLGVLQENVKGVKTGPIVGAFKSANPWDTQGQTIKASLNAIVPNLARGIYGEVGVLTDNDIKTYSKTIPNLKSTEDVRNAVLYITLDMIGKSIQNTLAVNEAAGRDVSGFVDLYTEMQNSKNSILASIPNASIPKSFQSPSQDPFLSQFSAASINSNISNSSFFNQF